MKITKIIIEKAETIKNDDGTESVNVTEETLNIDDAVVIAIANGKQVLTQTSDNESLNMLAIRTILKAK